MELNVNPTVLVVISNAFRLKNNDTSMLITELFFLVVFIVSMGGYC